MIGPLVQPIDTRSALPPPKEADPFYATAAYRQWQAIVIERAQGCCQDPQCKHPHRRGIRLFADHVQERRDRPDLELDPANGLARCGSCHTRKTHEQRVARQRR